MNILLAFAPFITFAVLDRLLGPVQGLLAGAAVAVAFLLRDGLWRKKPPKVLEIGTAILFAGLAAYALAGGAAGSVFGVRLMVDLGLLVVVLVSIAIRKPFTLQYAREQVPAELWASPVFVRTNYVISGVWALAFLAMALIDLVMIQNPDLPPKIPILTTIAVIVAAVKFTTWYPERSRDTAAAPNGGA